MSYSSELKKDLITELPEKRDVILGELAGLILGLARFEFKEDQIDFTIRTESAVLARYIFKLIQKAFSVKAKLSFERSSRFRKHHTFILNYEDASEILKETGALIKRKEIFFSPILGKVYYQEERVRRAFLRGLFLSSGSIINPEKSYHLEMDMPDDALTETIAEVLEDYDIEAHIVPKKGKSVLYLKDSQAISDFLALIGASKAVLNFEDVKVFKQMREKINRRVNCETANMKKSARAANEQIQAITYLDSIGALNSLDIDMKKIAKLRLKYPEETIGKLATMADPPISRSTLHRKLKRLVELATQEEENAE